MGRGAYVRIENKSNRTLDISYQDISCMFQDGQERSNFEPISGRISPNNYLPHTGEKQYIEKETDSLNPFNQCTYNNGFFTIKIKDASTEEDLGSIKFEANLNGYRCIDIEKMVQGLDIACNIDRNHIIQEIKLSVADSKFDKFIANYPYLEIEFNEKGQLLDSVVANEIVQRLEQNPKITDLIVFIHGMNNTEEDARKIYEHYFQEMRKVQGSDESIAVCGVIWPSQIMFGAQTWYEELYQTFRNAVGNLEKLNPAIETGKKGLAPFLNNLAIELKQRNKKICIHLAAHSMGTIMLASSLSELKVFISSVFLIQSPIPLNPLLSLPSQVDLKKAIVDGWVSGSVVCTYSDKDSLLKKIGLAASITGLEGFQGLSSQDVTNMEIRSGTKVDYKNFDKHFISLDCRDLILNHDDYKKVEVAQVHLAAIKKSREK